MDVSAYSWLDEWLFFKGLSQLQTRLLDVDFIYRTGTFRFSFLDGVYRHISYGARTMPARNRSSEIARCPSTDRKGADRVHQPFLQGPVHRSVMARNRLVTGNALSMLSSGYCHFLNWKFVKLTVRSLPGSLLVLWRANIYHPALATDLRSDSNPWRIGSNLFDTHWRP